MTADPSVIYEGYFIDTGQGRRYLACFGTPQPEKTLLYLPPFAEEMNLVRPHAARLATILARQGWCVVMLDYGGTGDSEGELEGACLSSWYADIEAARSWLETHRVYRPVLWGVRFGALLGACYLQHYRHGCDRWLLWQPLWKGRAQLRELFRLKQVTESFSGSGGGVDWLQRCLDGETVEVAGYPLTSRLAREIAALEWPSGRVVSKGLCLMLPGQKAARMDDAMPETLVEALPQARPLWQIPDCKNQDAWIEQSIKWLINDDGA